MNTDFDYLTALPGEEREQHWIKSRLETLSVREGIILAAAVQKEPPESTDQAINTLQALDYYNVCYPAGSYEQLGRHYLSHFNVPAEALPYIDFDQLGRAMMEEDGVRQTGYGLVRRLSKPFPPEQEVGMQMQ